MDDTNKPDNPQPRVIDGRGHNFFIVDNPVVDQIIETIEAKRRADAGWTYTVLCRLADNKTGECTLTISYLEKKTGRSKPIIIDALKALRDKDLIAVRRNHDANGHQTAPTYVILEVPKVKTVDPGDDARVNISPEPELTDLTANTKTLITKTVTPTNVGVADNGQHADDEEIIPLQKYVTNLLYEASKTRLGIRWSQDEYSYHLGRAKEMVEKDHPTQDELDQLSDAYITVHGFKGIKADAVEALKEIRTVANMTRVQSKARENGKSRSTARDEPPISGDEGEARRKEGYEWLFEGRGERNPGNDAAGSQMATLGPESTAEADAAAAQAQVEYMRHVKMIEQVMKEWRSSLDDRGYQRQVFLLRNRAEENGITLEDVESLDEQIRAEHAEKAAG